MVYICIPAYNEERTIGVVLWKIRQVMADFERDYQVLVVDDASTDGTGDVMEPYARIMPVHVRRNPARSGYAASLEALVREAVSRSAYPKRDVVVTLQADFTDEPGDIANLVKRVEGGADVVTGHVQSDASDTPLAVRWSRRAWQYFLGRGRGAVEGDHLSGFRAYRVITLRKALDEAEGGLLTTDGWAANAELLRLVAPHARRTEAVEVRVRPNRRQRESRLQPIQASLELVRLLRSGGPRVAVTPVPAEAAGGMDLQEEPVGAGGKGRRGRRGRGGGDGGGGGAGIGGNGRRAGSGGRPGGAEPRSA